NFAAQMISAQNKMRMRKASTLFRSVRPGLSTLSMPSSSSFYSGHLSFVPQNYLSYVYQRAYAGIRIEVSFPVRRPMNRPTNRLFACSGIAGLLLFLMVVPSWCQKSGSPGQGPSRPSGPTGGSAPNAPGQPSPMGPSGTQLQTPLYVNGRVLLMDTNQPSPEPVSVQLNCGPNLLQVIQTDLKGYFQCVLGAGPQSNANLSAA